MLRRIKRDYRQRKSRSKFLSFCKNIKLSLTDNQNYPDSIWGVNLALLKQYCDMVERLEVAGHAASNGDRILIRERDKIVEEVVLMLDQMASILEGASTRNPDALLTTGFSITQERRSPNRTRLPLVAPTDFTVENIADPGKALASANDMPGAFNQEIHINLKDPSSEADWFHKAIFPDAGNMMMENLNAGNTFFRVRHHGPDGAGPWSAVVTTTIT